MPPTYSTEVQIDTFRMFYGREHHVTATVASAVAGKIYFIEFRAYVVLNNGPPTDLRVVGQTNTFTAPGQLTVARLSLEDFELYSDFNQIAQVYLHARIVVTDGAAYAPGDVQASFAHYDARLEGYECLSGCEINGCQATCQTALQEKCSLFIETGCYGSCQIGCQGAGVQATCSLACQNAGEYYCTSTEETACSMTCEHSCTLQEEESCGFQAETFCGGQMELSPPGEIDDSTKIGGLLLQITRLANGTRRQHGDLLLIGQDMAAPTMWYRKIVAHDATPAQIAATAWTLAFVNATATGSPFNPEGIQCRDGAIYLAFAGTSTTVPPYPTCWLTRSLDLGVTWETPAMIAAVEMAINVTLMEDEQADEIIVAFVRHAIGGLPAEPTWPNVGTLAVKHLPIGSPASDITALPHTEFMVLPILFREGIMDGHFGTWAPRLRYAYGTYYLFYQQGDNFYPTSGAIGCVMATSLEGLKYGQPRAVVPGGLLSVGYMDVDFSPQGDVYLVFTGRRRVDPGKANLDLVMAVSHDGGEIWENEITLVRGSAFDGGSGAGNRCVFPRVVITDTGRLLVTHMSGNSTFSGTLDGWIQASVGDAPPLTCTLQCEGGCQALREFSESRVDVSGGIDSIHALAAIQLTRNAAGTPVANGNVVFVGVRVSTGIGSGSLYTKTVPYNATNTNIYLTPWVRIMTPPAPASAIGRPALFQSSNGALWVAQGMFGTTSDIRITKSVDLGVSWTLLEKVNTTAAGRVALLEDPTGMVVLYNGQEGFIWYKRFAVGAAPSSIMAATEVDLINDPDKKQPIPSDLPVALDGGIPNYVYLGIDALYSSTGYYYLVLSVGRPGVTDKGQLLGLKASTLDNLRFALPTVIAPERVSLAVGMMDSAVSADRKQLAFSAHRLREVDGELWVGYDSEEAASGTMIRDQIIFRQSADAGSTWQPPRILYDSGIDFDGFNTAILEVDRPQAWVSVLVSATASPFDPKLYLVRSDEPASCSTMCEAGFEVACSTGCEAAVQVGGCSGSCESTSEVGPAWTPDTFAALTLWLDAQTASTLFSDAGFTTPASPGGPVGGWADRSLTITGVTSTLTARPTLSPTLINGHPAVDFDGVNDILTQATGTLATLYTAAAYEIFMVMRIDVISTDSATITANDRPLGNSGATSQIANYLRSSTGLNVYNNDGAPDSVATAIGTGAMVIVHQRHEGGALVAAVNQGTEVGVASGATVSLAPVLVLGGLAAQFYDGSIGEILIYAASLTAAQRRFIYAYLRGRWS